MQPARRLDQISAFDVSVVVVVPVVEAVAS
jgi:hypothetical protein